MRDAIDIFPRRHLIPRSRRTSLFTTYRIVLSTTHTVYLSRKTGMSSLSSISAGDLCKKLRTETSVVVVDVRDEDRAGGHIKGSVHVPSGKLQREVSNFVGQWKNEDVVVFHCMMSQVRGPTCASAFSAALGAAVKAGDVQKVPEVLVLEGGFQEFSRSYSESNSDLFEDFKPQFYGTPFQFHRD